jgi:hypothetical protein
MRDVRKFMQMMRRQSTWLVLVYADWCGHCRTYKENVWNPMKTIMSRKMPMAEINETMYKKTPVGTATINGYPTVILLKKGTPHTEIQDAKNVTMMNKLVSSTPEEVERDFPSPNIQPMNTVTENVEEPVQEQEEPVPSLASEVNRSEQSAEIVRNSEAGVTIPMVEESQENTIGTPPNASDDLIRNTGEMLTPGPNATMVENISSNTGSNNERPKMGGGLYASLLKAAAPAVILTGAVAMTKRRRRKTRSKRRV